MELITSPEFLFLDEPTTGLDSSTASSVMTVLKKLVFTVYTFFFIRDLAKALFLKVSYLVS